MEFKEQSIYYLMQVKEEKERLEQCARDLKSLIVKADDIMIVRHHKKQLKYYLQCIDKLRMKCDVINNLIQFEDPWTNDYVDFVDIEVIDSILLECDNLVKIQEAEIHISDLKKKQIPEIIKGQVQLPV